MHSTRAPAPSRTVSLTSPTNVVFNKSHTHISTPQEVRFPSLITRQSEACIDQNIPTIDNDGLPFWDTVNTPCTFPSSTSTTTSTRATDFSGAQPFPIVHHRTFWGTVLGYYPSAVSYKPEPLTSAFSVSSEDDVESVVPRDGDTVSDELESSEAAKRDPDLMMAGSNSNVAYSILNILPTNPLPLKCMPLHLSFRIFSH
jgi:hypothetical protein